MARADPDTEEERTESREKARLAKVHEEAMRRFDTASLPQQEIRAHALLCRRFISIPGAMWEGPWGDQFENSIKVEIDKLSKGVDKIVEDYRKNRIVPDFRPAGGDSDADTASTLDGIHRADSYHFKAQQGRDNAFEEAAAGGFGAYRLANEYSDEFDPDDDTQRINPALIIVDADQRVYFDPNAKLYDKSDAKWAFVLTADAKASFEEEWEGRAAEWPENRLDVVYEWFAPDIVIKAEYYVVVDRKEELIVLSHVLSDEKQRHWAEDLDDDDLAELEAQGWRPETQKRMRRRIRKYVMTGAEILEDCGFIAGKRIPIVPVYGKRWYVDNQERFRGHVSKLMDRQRIYNAKVSKLVETDSLAPREKPIFLAEQMPPHLQDLWARQEHERHPYALVNPVVDAQGNYVAMGPIGKIDPPQLAPVTAALLQLAANDLAEETDDGADEVVANTSAEAMDMAATRVDAKSGIYLDNMRQSVQCEGEIYLGMAEEVYYEPGRVVETMTEDGDDGEAKLHEPYSDPISGSFAIRNDFSRGKYKVIADVTEATATRRDKTVKSSLATAQVAISAQDMELAQIATLTAVMNQDGEGMSSFQKYARRRLVAMGVEEPSDEEKAEMEAAAQAEAEAPDPAAILAEAQAEALKGSAAKDAAAAQKLLAEAVFEQLKPLLEGYKAETDRIKAVSQEHFPDDQLGDVVDRAGDDALASPDILPPAPRIRRGYELDQEQAA